MSVEYNPNQNSGQEPQLKFPACQYSSGHCHTSVLRGYCILEDDRWFRCSGHLISTETPTLSALLILLPLLRTEDRTILYYIFPPLGCQLHEGKDFRLLSSLLNAQSLEQCLAHSSHVSDVP